MRALSLAPAAVAVLAQGCATLQAPFRDHLVSAMPDVRECAAWFLALNASVDAAGTRDAQETLLAGFPYLRTNRLMASLRPVASSDDADLLEKRFRLELE